MLLSRTVRSILPVGNTRLLPDACCLRQVRPFECLTDPLRNKPESSCRVRIASTRIISVHSNAMHGTHAQRISQHPNRDHRFLSNFHFHIFPSKRFRYPFRSSGAFSSSTNPASRTFRTAPLPMSALVASSRDSAWRRRRTRERWAEREVSRDRRYCWSNVSGFSQTTT